MWFRRFRWSLAGALCVVAVERAGRAEPGVVVRYVAPEGCSTQAEFEGAVRLRGGRFEGAEVLERVREMSVEISRNERGFSGTLRSEAAEGPSEVREVHDPDCVEVTRGLSVVAAIALGGTGRERDESADAAAGPPSKTSEPAAPPRRELAVSPELYRDSERSLRGGTFGTPDSVEVPAGKLDFDSVASFTLGAGAEFPLLPGVFVPRYDFTITRAAFVTPPGSDGYLVGPVLQVRWSFLGPTTRREGDFSTDAFGFQAGISSCIALGYDTRGLSTLFCGDFGLGLFHLETEDAGGAVTQEKNAGFGTAGFGLDAKYALTPLFHVALRVGGHGRLGDVAAERPNGERLFELPRFTAHATAGVGAHFW